MPHSNIFQFQSEFECDRETLFAFHASPRSLNRLIPPWENVSISRTDGSLDVGSEVELIQKFMGFRLRWLARHTALSVPELFVDEQIHGPFQKWKHTHRFSAISPTRSKLSDEVEYELPFGALGRLGGGFIRRNLEAMFRERHRLTREDLQIKSTLQPFLGPNGDSHLGPRRIAITGSSGLIGQRLMDLASVLGIEVIRILRKPKSSVRGTSNCKITSISLEDEAEAIQQLNGIDAVIHLAGKGIADARWTDSVKSELISSRIDGTRRLVDFLKNLPAPPQALVSASGVGYYGDAGLNELAEYSPKGNGFLPDLAERWEKEALAYQGDRRRVAVGRLGMVLHPRQGALSKMLLPFRLGLGGRLGAGNQMWNWISADDAASAFLFLAMNSACAGVFNLVSPHSCSNQEFTNTLAAVLHRPALVPAPAFALRMMLGEMANELLLNSTNAKPVRLTEMGFPFREPNLRPCLERMLQPS